MAKRSLDDAVVALVERAYGLESISEIVPIAGGVVNSTFRLRQAGQDLVLTLFENGKSIAAANELGLFMASLQHVGVRVPQYRRNRSGSHAIAIDDRQVLLAPFIVSRQMSDDAVTAADCEAIGAVVAAFHAGQATLTLPTIDIPRWTPGAGSHEAECRVLARSEPRDRGLVIRLQEVTAGIPLESLPGGLVHTDVFPSNVIVDVRNDPYLIDFDEIAAGPFIADLCVAINSFCRNLEGLDFALREAMIRGYERGRKLTDMEVDYLPQTLVTAAYDIYCSRLLAPEMGLPPEEYLELARRHLSELER